MPMSVSEATDLLNKSVHRIHGEFVGVIHEEGDLLRGIKELITQEQTAGFPECAASLKSAIQDAAGVVADVIARATRLKNQLDPLAQ